MNRFWVWTFILLAYWKGYVAQAQLSTTAQWPKIGFSNDHSGQSPYNLSFTTPAANVKFQTGGSVQSSPAIQQDGRIVVGSFDGYVYCLTSAGSLEWMFGHQEQYADNQVYSSPAIAKDGSIVVGCNTGYIYSLTSAGTLYWTYQMPFGPGYAPDNAVQSSPAIQQDGSIIVGSWDYHIVCLTSAGSVRWTYNAGYQVNSSPAISMLDGSIVVGCSDNWIYCITSMGSLRWKYPTGGPVLSSPAIAQDGSIIIGSQDAYLYCLTSTGSLLWRYLTGGGPSSPAIANDGTIVVGSTSTYIYILGNQPTASPTMPPTLFPTHAPFMPQTLLRFDNEGIIGGSAAVAAFVALVLFLVRDGVDKGFSLLRHVPSYLLCKCCGAETKDRIPDDNDLTNLTSLEVLLPVTLSVTGAASNLVQIRRFLSSDDEFQTSLGYVMITARVCTALHSVVLLLLSLFRKSWRKDLVPSHLRKYAPLWFLVGLLMLTESSHICLFAWRHSDFADRSRGFPSLFVFKTCLLSSALSSLVQFSLSIAHGYNLFSSLSFGLSLMSFLLAISTAAIKLVAEKIHELAEKNEEQKLKAKIVELETTIADLRGQVDTLSVQPQPQTRNSSRLTFMTTSLFSSAKDENLSAVHDTFGRDSEQGMTAFRISASHGSDI